MSRDRFRLNGPYAQMSRDQCVDVNIRALSELQAGSTVDLDRVSNSKLSKIKGTIPTFCEGLIERNSKWF